MWLGDCRLLVGFPDLPPLIGFVMGCREQKREVDPDFSMNVVTEDGHMLGGRCPADQDVRPTLSSRFRTLRDRRSYSSRALKCPESRTTKRGLPYEIDADSIDA